MSFKFSNLVLTLCLVALTAPLPKAIAQDEAAAPGIKPAAIAKEMTEEEMLKTFSILIGYNQIGEIKAQLDNDGIAIDGDAAIEGARRAFAGEEVGIPIEEITTVMGEMQKRVLAARAEQQKDMQAQREKMMAQLKETAAKNRAAGEAYLKENGAKAGVKTLEGGVQYEVLTEGTGPKPMPSDKIKINYHGTFIDGTVFDSTVWIQHGRSGHAHGKQMENLHSIRGRLQDGSPWSDGAKQNFDLRSRIARGHQS